jgi:hypothetical protein
MRLNFPVETVLYQTPLSALQQKFLLDEVLGYHDWRNVEYTLGPQGCMIVWVATFLSQLPWLAQEQWRLLIQESSADLVRMAGLFHQARQQKTFLFSFVDARYATWTGITQFLDLETGDWIPSLGHRGFEHVGYDLLTLALREDAKCTARQESRDANQGSA